MKSNDTDIVALMAPAVPADRVDAHVGRRLRRLREARGFAPAHLACLASCDEQVIRAVEAGRSSATHLEIYKLARALGVKMQSLFQVDTEQAA